MTSFKKYWIDESCHGIGEQDFDVYIREARYLAGRAAARLQRASDTDFARVFNVIYKTPKTDNDRFPPPYLYQLMHGFGHEQDWRNVLDQTRAVLVDFSTNWRRTNRRQEADVRIYSDAGERWLPTSDPEAQFYDPINHIYLTGELEELYEGQAFTSYRAREGVPGETPHRVTIDLCEMGWEGLETNAPISLGELHSVISSQDLTQINIGDIGEHLITRLIFHEFMHCSAYGRDDAPGDNEGHTSGWEYCMRLTKSQACAGAESIAYLALAAGLAEMRPQNKTTGGFTIDRTWDAIPGSHDLPDPSDFDEDDMDDEDNDQEFLEKLAEIRRKRQGNRKWDDVPENLAIQGTLLFYDSLTN
ncbi:hypothetical protein V8F33_004510 [Rhypophila sp. PSN 637]